MSQGPVNHKCKTKGVKTNANTPNKHTNDAYETKNADGLTVCEVIDKSQVCIKKGADEYNKAITEVKTSMTVIKGLLEGEKYPDRTAAAYPDGVDTGGVIFGPGKAMVSAIKRYQDKGPLFAVKDASSSVSNEEAAKMQKTVESFRRPMGSDDGSGFTVKTNGRNNNIVGMKNTAKELDEFKTSAVYKNSPKQAQYDKQIEDIKKSFKKAEKTLNGPELGGNAGEPGSSCVEALFAAVSGLSTAGSKDLLSNVKAGVKQHGDMKKAVKDAEENYEKTRPGALVVEFTYDLQYKEQCILLSQLAPLAAYSYALDDKDLYKDAVTPDGEKAKLRRRLPYAPSVGTKANAPLLIDGESFGFMNKLTQYPGLKPFYNMTPAQLSSLQPLIRLYKAAGVEGTGAATEKEIYFDSYFNNKTGKLDLDSILKNKAKRGFGVGLKSLNVTFDGQDMFAQKRCIKANLSIFANDFDELLIDRGGFRYIDLALKTGKNIKSQKTKKYKSNDELNFRLKAVFGWQMPNGKGPADALKESLKNTYVSVNLTPVTHTFDFDDFGRVTFNIEYLAYVEEFYAKPTMDVFTDPETFSKILRRRLAFESANRAVSNSADGCKEADALRKQVKETKTADREEIKKEKQVMHARLINTLFLGGYIHHLNFSRQDLESVIKLGPYHDVTTGKVTKGDKELNKTLNSDLIEAFKDGIKEGTADKEKRKEMAGALMVTGADSINIPFFYIGDLLNVIMGSMTDFIVKLRENIIAKPAYQTINIAPDMLSVETNSLSKAIKEYERFRLVMGPLEIVNHADESVRYVNFADVPISVKYFSEWLTSKLLKKDQAIYPLTQFLKDLFNDLLKNFLNDDSCYPFSIKQKVRLFEGVITSYPGATPAVGVPPTDEITSLLKGTMRNRYNRLNILNKTAADWSGTGELRPILNIRGKSPYDRPNPGIESEINYFVFYAGRTQPLDLMNGKKNEDENRGIFHYMLGKDHGLLKTIKLNKTDTPGLKEVRFEQEGYDGLHQLREVYDVEIDSYANMTAFPGNYIFVDPQGFAPQMAAAKKTKFDLTDLGVGGYYMVTKASHELGPGIANTKLDAVWVASMGSQEENSIIEAARGGNEMKSAKCHSVQSRSGKVGSDSVSGYYEGASGTTDLSALDDNPESPSEEAARTHTEVTGEASAAGLPGRRI